jgi:hypothetical protein
MAALVTHDWSAQLDHTQVDDTLFSLKPNVAPEGSNEGPNGPCVAPEGPNEGLNGPNEGPKGPNEAPYGPKEGSDGPNEGPIGTNEGLNGPNKGSDGPNEGSDGPDERLNGPDGRSNGPNKGSKGPNKGSDGPNEASKGPIKDTIVSSGSGGVSCTSVTENKLLDEYSVQQPSCRYDNHSSVVHDTTVDSAVSGWSASDSGSNSGSAIADCSHEHRSSGRRKKVKIMVSGIDIKLVSSSKQPASRSRGGSGKKPVKSPGQSPSNWK